MKNPMTPLGIELATFRQMLYLESNKNLTTSRNRLQNSLSSIVIRNNEILDLKSSY